MRARSFPAIRHLIRGSILVAVGMLAAGCTAPVTPIASPSPTSSISEVPPISTIAVVGDSISVGVNACDAPGACPEASWAVGSDSTVDSLARRVEAATGSAPETIVAARAGATVDDALSAVENADPVGPDLVAILIGANDACTPAIEQMTSAEDFEARFSRLVSTIEEGSPSTRMLVLSIPDLGNLWDIGHTDPVALERWGGSTSCSSLLQDAESESAAAVDRRDAVDERVREFNTITREVCDSIENCVHDEGAMFDYKFTPAEISSLDYFHPSVAGQSKIAELAWNTLDSAGIVEG